MSVFSTESLAYKEIYAGIEYLKQFYAPLLLTSPLDHEKKTLLPVPTPLAYTNVLLFFFFTSRLFDGQYTMFTFSDTKIIVTNIIPLREMT